MRALICEAYGAPKTLEFKDIPVLAPGDGQVLVRVSHVGLNFFDGLVVAGRYQVRPEPPFSPGSEIAGVIEACGSGVTDLAVGMPVMAACLYGGMAEYCLVDAINAVALPPDMDFAIGAAMTIVYATACHALVQRATLQAGETVLVLGAAGGTGLAAVEVANALGARVIACASTDEKCALAVDHGADGSVNYVAGDLRAQLRELAHAGVDVVFDPVGGDLSEPCFRSLAPGGRHLVIGFAGGAIPSLALNLPLVKEASLVGVYQGAFSRREPDAHRQNMERIFAWQREGLVRPVIDRTFPLEEGAAAIRYLLDRRARGKVLVQVG